MNNRYRLSCFQAFNWGVFDKLHTIRPAGQNTLLTGANGSGKSTLVDGLLTLVAPYAQGRIYNQSANSDKGRNEASYIRGEVGKGDRSGVGGALRSGSLVSALLAIFTDGKRPVTLGRVFSLQGSELKRTYIVAEAELNIRDHLDPLDTGGQWKNPLRQRLKEMGLTGFIISDEPGLYAQRMRELFGMKEKAHTLFAKATGIKTMPDLSQFIRQEMLEEGEGKAALAALHQQFTDLDRAHSAIRQARRQIELLEPVEQAFNQLKGQREVVARYEQDLATAEAFLPRYALERLKAEVSKAETHAERKAAAFKEANYLLEIARGELDAVKEKLKGDEAFEAIQMLEAQAHIEQKELTDRQAASLRYLAACQRLGLREARTLVLFEQNQRKAEARLAETEHSLETLEEQLRNLSLERLEQERKQGQISSQLQHLKAKKTNIDERRTQVRDNIAENTGLSIEELPFVGEQVRVADGEQDWEPALERLLHGFGQQVLVAPEHYRMVSTYVNGHHLGGQIVYRQTAQVRPAYPDSSSAGGKIEINEGVHPLFANWISRELNDRYNHRCVDTDAAYDQATYALSIKGQIKGGDTHRKDDRSRLGDVSTYVLGKDNGRKILLLVEELGRLQDFLQKLRDQEKAMRSQIDQHKKLRDDFQYLLRDFPTFEPLDADHAQQALADTQRRLQELKSNPDYQHLQTLHDTLKQTVQERDDQRLKANTDWRRAQESLAEQEQQLDLQEVRVAELTPLDLPAEWLEDFALRFQLQERSLLDLFRKDGRKGEILASIENELRIARLEESKLASAVTSKIQGFRSPETGDALEFPNWHAAFHDKGATDADAALYVELLNQIRGEELAGLEQRFRDMLRVEIIDKTTEFADTLSNQEDKIKEDIEKLNASLGGILYDKSRNTYLRLGYESSRREDLRLLRERLRTWKPDPGIPQGTPEHEAELERSYQAIKTLLEELAKPAGEVLLDVRRWLDFYAAEIQRGTQTQGRLYEGTASLSGGEGTQLTYALLCAALAHQFSIGDEQARASFHFVCIDETFSKQDDAKAEFLMDLCRQLDLQVMIVSPSKPEDFATAQPYIQGIHYVKQLPDRASTVLDMNMEEFEERLAAQEVPA